MKSYCLALDVAKGKSVAALVSGDGSIIMGPTEVGHDPGSLSALSGNASKLAPDYAVIMEATSVYHRVVEAHFRRLGKETVVTNPLLAHMAKQSLRKTKTDAIDCLCLAQEYFAGNYTEVRESPNSTGLQSQSRLLDSISGALARAKMAYLLALEPCYPGLEEKVGKEALYSDTGLRFVAKYPHPSLLGRKATLTVARSISPKPAGASGRSASVSKIMEAARAIEPTASPDSMECHSLSARAASLLAMKEAKERESEALVSAASALPEFSVWKTFRGIGDPLAAYLTAEIGDPTRFESEKNLIAYCGLDPTIVQSGRSINYRGPISKRGNKYARKHLFQAVMMILRRDGLEGEDSDIAAYYKKKRSDGKHHYVAVVACSTKLLRKFYYRSRDLKRTGLLIS